MNEGKKMTRQNFIFFLLVPLKLGRGRYW